MTNQNKLSRREAIKILGTATGASLLANLPAKWSKPELAGSFLPAHAQSSCTVLVFVSTTVSIGNNITQIPIGTPANASPPLTWYCQEGCAGELVQIASGSISYDLIVMGVPVTKTYNTPGFHGWMVNLQTGQLIDYPTQPFSPCLWPDD